eukprot:EG_transcript_22819
MLAFAFPYAFPVLFQFQLPLPLHLNPNRPIPSRLWTLSNGSRVVNGFGPSHPCSTPHPLQLYSWGLTRRLNGIASIAFTSRLTPRLSRPSLSPPPSSVSFCMEPHTEPSPFAQFASKAHKPLFWALWAAGTLSSLTEQARRVPPLPLPHRPVLRWRRQPPSLTLARVPSGQCA